MGLSLDAIAHAMYRGCCHGQLRLIMRMVTIATLAIVVVSSSTDSGAPASEDLQTLRKIQTSERFSLGEERGGGSQILHGPPTLFAYVSGLAKEQLKCPDESLACPTSKPAVAKSAAHSPAECSVAHPCHMFNMFNKVPSTGGLLLTHDATKKPMSTVAKRSIKKDSQEWLLTMWIRRDRDPKNWRIQDPKEASWRFGWPNWDNEIPARKCRGWRGRRNKKCAGAKHSAEGAEMGKNQKKGWSVTVYNMITVGWGYNRFNDK